MPLAVIERGQGITDTERYLARLAERSFLNLWCYPNVFIDKRSGGAGDGKEMCDLLVVCGDHVLIFSDKEVAWPGGEDVQLAWRRWYKRAIQKSVGQIRGAQRWLSQFPERIFIDRACSQPLPIALPPPERRKVHGIVVANGAAAACRSYFDGGTGSLVLRPSITGEAHFEGMMSSPSRLAMLTRMALTSTSSTRRRLTWLWANSTPSPTSPPTSRRRKPSFGRAGW
jgi:hypothetical protein